MTTNAPATDNSMQDITSRLESVLDLEHNEDEPGELDNEVLDDDVNLPDGDDSDADDEGSEDEDDANDEDEDEGDSDSEDEDYTISGLLGVEDDRVIVDDDGKVFLNAIVDGESKQVPISDLVVSYQTQGHVNNKSIALENERKEFDGHKQTIAVQLKKDLEQASQLATIAAHTLTEDFNSIDWDKLRSIGPAQWTALRQEYTERAGKVSQMQEVLNSKMKEQQDSARKEFETNRTQHLASEYQKMVTANPTWTDKTKMQAEMGEIRSFVKAQYGFEESDLDAVTDHRLISLIQDAKAFRKGTKAAESKKVKKVPSFQKPRAANKNGKQLTKARAVKAKRAAVKNTGHINDVAALLEDRM